MKKLMIGILILILLGGCVPVPVYEPQGLAETAAPTAAPTVAPTATPTVAPTAAPTPAAANTAAPASSEAPKITETPAAATDKPAPKTTATPKQTATPKPTVTPRPTATPTPTVPPKQTYAGTYFKFDAPGSWLKATIPDGVYFYPDVNDTQHTFFLYEETPNDMNLTETKLDIALAFSSKETITSMVEGALVNSGMTGFSLAPMTVKKTALNGITCYKGSSTISFGKETFDFTGHIFLRKEKMVLLIWVGDQAKNEEGLRVIYDSLQALR